MKSWHLFLGLSIIGLITTYGIQTLFFTDALLQQTFGGQIAHHQIQDMFAQSKQWQWVGYVLIPFVIALRTLYSTLSIYTGLYLYDLPIGFGRIFRSALVAEFSFALSAVFKLLIAIFFKQVETLADLQFQPLSIMEIVNSESVEALFLYPLSFLNLFELLYVLWVVQMVVKQVYLHHPESMNKRLYVGKVVLFSYVSGWLLWTLLVMFATLNLT